MSLDREKYFFTPRYSRGEVAKVLGVTKDTLRHYEKCGLITPHENEENRYKYYSIADLEILNVILFLRSMDVPVQDIPIFIECKDINKYGNFLDEQINKAMEKINYWNNIKNILTYLKNTLENYKETPRNVKVLENIYFRFRVAKFDYKNYDLQQMAPSTISSNSISNIIKLKIVDEKWLISNRVDTSEMIVGYISGAEEVEGDIWEHCLPLALMITTLDPLEKIPQIIIKTWEAYKHIYDFEYKVYILEHTFFNIFNQEALLRNVYLPIKGLKDGTCKMK